MTPKDPGERFEDRWEARRRKWEARMERRMARRTYGGISAGHGPGFGLVVGACILLLGVLFLLENLGFVPVVRWGALWPVILIAVGIARLIETYAVSPRIGGEERK